MNNMSSKELLLVIIEAAPGIHQKAIIDLVNSSEQVGVFIKAGSVYRLCSDLLDNGFVTTRTNHHQLSRGVPRKMMYLTPKGKQWLDGIRELRQSLPKLAVDVCVSNEVNV